MYMLFGACISLLVLPYVLNLCTYTLLIPAKVMALVSRQMSLTTLETVLLSITQRIIRSMAFSSETYVVN
jgi:hypothetical protein